MGILYFFNLSLIFVFIFPFIKKDLVFEDYFGLSLILISGICIIIFTKKFLDKKSIYRTSELSPIIKRFTDLSDHNELKLFGGDLNFFGNTPSEMDMNDQYNHLKSLCFRMLLILCEVPADNSTKIRYGKIIQEMRGVELKFYKPDEADLQIRARLKTLQGAERLLIYSKVDSGLYQTIETDTANSNGALYSNIWRLIWSLAREPSRQQIEEFKSLFNN